MNCTLAQALRVDESKRIAFVGSGGKTTAMFQLAKQLKPPVIVTATSRLGVWQIPLADKHLIVKSQSDIESLEKDVTGVTLITGDIKDDKTEPVSQEIAERLHEFCASHSIPLLIEADGSRKKPLKGWAEHEPPTPDFVEHVVTVAGLSGLGKPLTEEHVHRPELFAEISGVKAGESIDSNSLVRALLHENSSLKNIPNSARRTVVLNQADTYELQANARATTQALLSKYQSVVISSLKQEKIFATHEPVAGIILAAGESSRYGQPKQLLDWKGEPFVRVVARRALEAGLAPVVVVTGANAEGVESAVKDLNVKIVRNSEWKSGQASSIREGVFSIQPPPPFGHLPQIRRDSYFDNNDTSVGFGGGWEGVGAGIFLLVDQPQITTSILQALVERHTEGLHSVVAPMVMDRRANPVLFDRRTFADLLTLEGDTGGRAIFHKHQVEYLPWHDDRLLLDVDTPEHYQRLLADET
ncbi:MAG: putative selenium-dependent hydroxylase accessory protein YqeC, partial [Anaerolineales bacterium]|nr:putative selenium-dependent hydroxylase accessory protein YqeC [Anaerolineales bacterium]